MSQSRHRRVVESTVRCALEPLEERRLFAAGVALDAGNRLLSFDTASPSAFTKSVTISGLGAGESILAIDYRPATGGLYGLGSASRLYSINPSTGVATQIGSDFAVPLVPADAFDLDFNPSVDRIRITSISGQNLRVNPDTGAVVDGDGVTVGVQSDGNLAYAAGDPNDGDDAVIVASAYTKNFLGGTGTTLYAIDSGSNALVTIGSVGGTPTSPNTGQISTVGALGFDVGKRAGLDIVSTATTETAFAVLQVVGQVSPALFSINLVTGAATSIGSFGERRIVDAAIAPPPAVAFALTSSNELLAFFTNDPTNILRQTRIKGLAGGENVLGIDFRPATGELIAVTSEDKMYTVNPKNGRTVQIGTGTFAVPTSGTSFGFDFNPAVDRIRLVSDADQNARLNPLTGGVVDSDMVTVGTQIDGPLAFDGADANSGVNPNVVASAYTNNDNDAGTPTTLYGIDSSLNALVGQGSLNGTPTSPNTGTLFTVGSLGVNVTAGAGFDIMTRNGLNEAYAALRQESASSRPGIYRIDLATGVATRLGTIGGGNRAIAGLAIVPA